MHNKLIALLLLPLPLMGCTDVRGRISPDVLAVSVKNDGTADISARCSGDDDTLHAHAESPLTLCPALQTAAGKAVDAGHVSLLCLDGDPAALLPDYLAMQVLMPTTEVLWCRALPDALPDVSLLRTAVAAGLLPARTADRILGDLQNGSGVSAVPTMKNGALTLALCDETGICGTLPTEACRGLALLGKRWQGFTFPAGAGAVTVLRTHFRLTADMTDGHLRYRLTGWVRCQPEGLPQEHWVQDAERVLTEMLVSACEIPVHTAGADLLLLRETAIRDGIPDSAACTPAEWRARLMTAEFAVQIEVRR